jgi:BCD family chlorophyll transporter-like MFS transporter
LRLASFHIGSAMGDILVTSIWNRILISNFGIPAAPVSLLIALRYLLSPLSLIAGHWSDNKLIRGLHRTPFIWGGRLLMILSLPLLGVSVMRLGESTTDVVGWLAALLSSLLYGIGTLVSGSPFLALVRESAPEEKQGRAIALVETALIIFFAITGITFSLWMETYSLQTFWQMIIATMAIGGFFWFFAIFRVEKPGFSAAAQARQADPEAARFRNVLGEIWADRRTRLFFAFLALATLSAWAKDAVLEPFGADTFDLAMGTTTRFNSYWQGLTVITLLSSFAIWRKRRPEHLSRVAGGGLLIMALGISLLGVAGLAGQRHLIELGLLIFGAGFGFYSFGGLSLMAVMSPDPHAGAYLGLWTISILVFKGLGTFLGGAVRDILMLNMGLAPGVSYGAVFLLQAIGLATAALILSRTDIVGFAGQHGRHVSMIDAQVAAAD